MMEVHITRTSPDELKHFGIKGQKWGLRRFQNKDGTYTEEGKKRYGSDRPLTNNQIKEYQKEWIRTSEASAKNSIDAIKLRTKAHELQNKGSEKDKKMAETLLKKADEINAKQEINQKEFDAICEKLDKAQDWQDTIKSGRNLYDEGIKLQVKMDQDRESFDHSRKDIKEKGMMSWWDKVRGTKDEDSFFDHVFDTQGKLLDRWWDERYETNSIEEWDKLQSKYCNQLAKNLGIPPTRENLGFLADWFVNGDD